MNNNTLIDALYVVCGDSGASDRYRKGMMEGIMDGLAAWARDAEERSGYRRAANHVRLALLESKNVDGVPTEYQTAAMLECVPDAPLPTRIPPNKIHERETGLIVGMMAGWMYGTGRTFETAVKGLIKTGEFMHHFPHGIDEAIPLPKGWGLVREVARSLPLPQVGDAPHKLQVEGVFTQGIQGWYVYGECNLCGMIYIGTRVDEMGYPKALPLGEYMCNGEAITHCECQEVTE